MTGWIMAIVCSDPFDCLWIKLETLSSIKTWRGSQKGRTGCLQTGTIMYVKFRNLRSFLAYIQNHTSSRRHIYGPKRQHHHWVICFKHDCQEELTRLQEIQSEQITNWTLRYLWHQSKVTQFYTVPCHSYIDRKVETILIISQFYFHAENIKWLEIALNAWVRAKNFLYGE